MDAVYRLMSEFFQCQDRLVRSACGSSIADFILAVSIENHLRLATDAELQRQHCRPDTILYDYPTSNAGTPRLRICNSHRIHNVHHAAYCDRWSCSVVCQFVRLSVTRLRWAKMAKRVEVLFRVETLGGPKTHCVKTKMGVQMPPRWGDVWRGLCQISLDFL